MARREAFFSLGENLGCDLSSFDVKTTKRGDGIFSRKFFDRGDTLLRIPSKSVISPVNAVKKQPFLLSLLEMEAERGSSLFQSTEELLALFLLFESRKGETSEFHLYIQTLPAQFSTPLFWNEEELRLLGPMEKAARGIISNLKAMEQRLQEIAEEKGAQGERESTPVLSSLVDRPPTFDELRRFHSAVTSRSMEFPMKNKRKAEEEEERGGERGEPEKEEGDDVMMRALVPLADFINHRNEGESSNAVFELDSETGDVIVTATASIDENDEIRFNYGERSAEEYLFSFGFLPKEEASFQIVLPMPTSPADPLFHEKLDALFSKGLELPLRIDCSSDDGAKNSHNSAEADPSKKGGNRTEDNTLKEVIDGLAALTATSEEAVMTPQRADRSRARAALIELLESRTEAIEASRSFAAKEVEKEIAAETVDSRNEEGELRRKIALGFLDSLLENVRKALKQVKQLSVDK